MPWMFHAARSLAWYLVSLSSAMLMALLIGLALIIWAVSEGESPLVSVVAVASVLTYLVAVLYRCLAPLPVQEERAPSPFSLIGLLFPWFFYGFASGSLNPRGFLQLVVYTTIPLALTLSISEREQGRWQATDLLTILFLWLPFDARLLNDIWPWPEGKGAYPVNTLLAMCLAFFLFSDLRRLPSTGLPFRSRGTPDLRELLVLFALFCSLVIPLGLLTDFIKFSVSGRVEGWLLGFPGIMIFIALPEEYLFRGLMLSCLRFRFPNISAGVWVLVTSVIFGLSHLNNPPLYDWRYLLLSTIGGIFYGVAFLRSGNLLLPVLLHTLVDFVWVHLFSG